MTRYPEWLTRWADRWVQDATAEIRRREEAIDELSKAAKDASDENERDWYESLIEEHKSVTDSIRQCHRQWQRRAKRRWHLNMSDLSDHSAESDAAAERPRK